MIPSQYVRDPHCTLLLLLNYCYYCSYLYNYANIKAAIVRKIQGLWGVPEPVSFGSYLRVGVA